MPLTLGAYTQNPCSKLELDQELHCIPPPSLSHIGKEIQNSFLIGKALALPPANDIFFNFFMFCDTLENKFQILL